MKLYQDEKHKKGRRTQKYYGDSPTSTLKKAAARISFIKGFQNTEVRILELNTIVSVPKKREEKSITSSSHLFVNQTPRLSHIERVV